MLRKNDCLSFALFSIIVLLSFGLTFAVGNDVKSPTEQNIEDLLRQMTLEEKIKLLGGDETGFNSQGIERLGIPPIRMTDGPVGVRDGQSTAFPVSINMAASWDKELIYRYGIALAEETKAKGKNCILGPCVGLHRFPLNGRNFESFGEDPYLAAQIAVSFIKGVQSKDVIATVKHFACNDQEWERNNYDVIVDDRTLHEIHLVPFEYAVKEGGVRAVMSSYNLVNGWHSSENKQLLTDILKTEWGFKGLVISDWVSVYSAVEAANNGLDVEMPQPKWFGETLLAAVKEGKVSENVINDKVRRHLRVRFETNIFQTPSPTPDESVIRSEAHKELALEMALHSMILLKNDGILPLPQNKLKTIALIGPNAKIARTGGGGSSMVQPWRSVSPYDGLTSLLGNSVAVEFAEGTNMGSFVSVPVPLQYIKTPNGKTNGFRGEYFNNPQLQGQPILTRTDGIINFDFFKNPVPEIGASDFSVRWTGRFTAPQTRRYRFSLSSDDGSRLYIDDKLMINNWSDHGDRTVTCAVDMQAGRSYDMKIEYYQGVGLASIRFGWKDPADTAQEPSIEQAVEVAKKADIAVLCVGNTPDYESEGSDVADFKMYGDQDEMVQAVAAANPNTIVVVYGGVPVLMKSWLGNVKAVIAALYPGQEGGTALAEILFGKINPSGKLPFSYIQERSESPAFADYRNPDLKVRYSEGIFVGYRYCDKNNITSLFPFGHGLSYTTFEYSGLKLEADKNGYTVTVNVKNTGNIPGQEIVQLYVSAKNSSIERPVKELKGFDKVQLAPGQSKKVNIHLDGRSFAYYHPDKKQWVVEPGLFEILVGASSRDIKLKSEIKL